MKRLKKLAFLLLAMTIVVAGSTTSVDAAVRCKTHTLSKVLSVKATCETDGYDLYKCRNIFCTYTEKFTTEKACGHAYRDNINDRNYSRFGNTYHSCLNCGKVQAHSYNRTLVSEATCTSPAVYVNQCVCGLIHGDAYTRGEVAEHTLSNVKWLTHANYKEATCTEDGNDVFKCTECGEAVSVKVPATGHTVVNQDAVAATCTEDGLTAGSYCSTCNTVFEEQTVIKAEGHKAGTPWLTDSKQATCEEDGYDVFKCSVCNEKYSVPVAAKGHAVVIDNAVVPKCGLTSTETGLTEGSHCSACHKVLVAQEIVKPAMKHIYGEFEENDGVYIHTCTICGYVERLSF